MIPTKNKIQTKITKLKKQKLKIKQLPNALLTILILIGVKYTCIKEDTHGK